MDYLQSHRRNLNNEDQRQCHNQREEDYSNSQQLEDQIVVSRRRIPAVRASGYKYESFRSIFYSETEHKEKEINTIETQQEAITHEM